MNKKLKVSQIANASALAATTSYPYTASNTEVVSVQAVYTSSTSSYTLALQYSNNGTTWSDFTTATTIANDSGNVMWNVCGTKDALYWRVIATKTSGTLTTLTAFLAYQPR